MIFEFKTWGWLFSYRKYGPVVTGSGHDLAATWIVSVFGFGFCVFDRDFSKPRPPSWLLHCRWYGRGSINQSYPDFAPVYSETRLYIGRVRFEAYADEKPNRDLKLMSRA